MINKTKDLLKELIYFIVCCGYWCAYVFAIVILVGATLKVSKEIIKCLMNV